MADHRPESETGESMAALDAPHTHDSVERTPHKLSTRVLQRARSESGEVASWLIFMLGLVIAAAFAAGVLAFVFNELTRNVVEAAEVDVAVPDVPMPDRPEVRGPNQGNGDGLPVRTLHCRVSADVGAGVVVAGLGLGGNLEFIIQEMPDGSQVITFAGDASANTGPGATAGAGITVNDATVGAYATTSANAHGSIGGGVQFVLAPGETLTDFFAGLAVSSNPITHVGGSVVNTIFPGDPIPQADLPDSVFVDASIWGDAGGSAQAGVGFVSAGGGANASGGVHESYAIHADGTYSATTTYSGELNGDANITGGIPFFAWGQAGVAGEAQGSISVETIYNGSFEPVEMIVTTSYGHDGDAILGPDDDNPTITTQQWTLDLTDPEVAAAVDNLDALTPGLEDAILGPAAIPGNIPTENPLDSWDVVTDNATTTGAIEQELSTSELDISVNIGLGIDASAGVGGGCTVLE